MSEMNTHESWERLNEGLQRTASCCRELGVMTNVKDWTALSNQLLLMLKKARVMYRGAALTEIEVQTMVTEMEIAQKAAALMK